MWAQNCNQVCVEVRAAFMERISCPQEYAVHVLVTCIWGQRNDALCDSKQCCLYMNLFST